MQHSQPSSMTGEGLEDLRAESSLPEAAWSQGFKGVCVTAPPPAPGCCLLPALTSLSPWQ